jgi:uncharacterized protein
MTPSAFYQPGPDSDVVLDREFYTALADDTDGRELLDSFVIGIRSGRAWEVPAGHLCRVITTPDGPQCGDFNVWNRHDPRERLWTSRTRQLHGTHVSVHDRLWSTLPFLRPLLTITADTLDWYGVDADGGRVHDLLGARCDPYANRLLTGVDFDYTCHSNLIRAVLPYGLTEYDVHDVLNIFAVTGITPDGQYFMKGSPAGPGDFFEFFAEQDLLCAISTCPAGDLSVPMWGPQARDPIDVCRPLAIEVYRPEPRLTARWREPRPVPYRGSHGLRAPQWSAAR